jgi:hypothetical protein
VTRDLSPLWIALVGIGLLCGLVWLGSLVLGR